MIWSLKQVGGRASAARVAHIERRLQFALARFSGHIQRVQVVLEDQNGPRGGLDKNCRVVVRLREAADVVAEVTDVNWEIAVDRATSRVGHTVARRLARRRANRRIARPLSKVSPGVKPW